MTWTLTNSPLMALMAEAPGIGRGFDGGDIAHDARGDEQALPTWCRDRQTDQFDALAVP